MRTETTKNLYLTVAIPASKKTTTCRGLSKKIPGLVAITVDNFRLGFYGEQYNEKQEEYLKKIITHIIFSLSKNPDLSIILDESKFLIDVTNRKQWIDFGKRQGFKIIALCFDKSLEFCLENNSKRKENKVPEDVILELYRKLEPPELSEGFDDIIYV